MTPNKNGAGNGGNACGFMVASGSAVPDLGRSAFPARILEPTATETKTNENEPQTSARLHGAFPAPALSSPWPASRLHNQQTNRFRTATSPRKMGGSHGGPRERRKNHHHDHRQFTPLSPGHELLV